MNQDISELLTPDQDAGPTKDLPIISVWQMGIHYVMFFMTAICKYKSHFDEGDRKSYLCLGDPCPACGAGIKATEHIYLPVWDVQGGRIVVLRVDSRNDGPARRIAQFIELYRAKLHDVVAVIECKGDGKGSFTITAHAPLPETDRGALACKAFGDGLEAGTIDLRNCVRRLSADEIVKLVGAKITGGNLVGEPVGPCTAPLEGEPTETPVKSQED